MDCKDKTTKDCTHLTLTKRQRAICNLIPKCDILCDVGCDHGKIGYFALNANRAGKVIFIDISQKCLDKAKILCGDTFADRAQYICQDGLGDTFCHCAVIGGMGGLEIMGILQRASNLPFGLILQPMRDVATLRQYLCEQGYTFVYDEILLDKKYYDILYLEGGRDSLTYDELNFGRTNVQQKGKDFLSYAKKEILLADKILKRTDSRKDLEIRRRDLIRLTGQGEEK